MFLQWQKNQNGTHYAEHGADRWSIRRPGPRVQSFTIRRNGEYVGTARTLEIAKAVAALRAGPNDAAPI